MTEKFDRSVQKISMGYIALKAKKKSEYDKY